MHKYSFMPLKQGNFISKGFHQIEGLTVVATVGLDPKVALPIVPSRATVLWGSLRCCTFVVAFVIRY